MQCIVTVVNFIMVQPDPQTSNKPINLQRIRRYALVALAVLVTISLLALAMPSIERQLDKWGLLPRHEQLTELYIPDAKYLLATYTPGEQHAVLFEVRNLEGETQAYGYTITAQATDGKDRLVMQLAQGSLTVKDGETGIANVATQLQDWGKRIYIQVELSNGHKVGYWLEQGR